MWVDVARLVRGQVLSLRERNYIRISRSVGTSHWGIIIKHILPNILSSLFVIGAANFAIAILIEAGLSYLGFGVQPPIPSLGNMLNENYGFALSGKIFMAIIPATVIMLLVLSFNLAGNGLRDIFDVKD
jgi:peptide/nickel transport system permease protein